MVPLAVSGTSDNRPVIGSQRGHSIDESQSIRTIGRARPKKQEPDRASQRVR
jgi:hypothetical protein